LPGRTARIGNHGLATSFFNDSNSDIAPELVKILLETNQELPEFLEPYKPDGELNFDEPDTDEENNGAVAEDATGGFGGDDWGNGGGAGATGGDDWGIGGGETAADNSGW
jgi:ATP-dependent RNA helicase DDX3X